MASPTSSCMRSVTLGLSRGPTADATQASAHPVLDVAGADLFYDQGSAAGPRDILVDGH